MCRAPLAMLLVAALAIIAYPSMAGAITIHQHVRDPLTHKPIVRVVTVAPADTDDDGCANARDTYGGPGCKPPPPPPPAPVATTSGVATAPTPVTTSVAPSSASAIPGYITACESGGNYSAVNPSSGAYGAYQIMPSTSSAYGCDMSTPAGQDACAAKIYADVGSSAWSCG